MKQKKRVLVGMSGGVDSSVTAALLKKRGYDVIGITMQLLSKEEEHESACCNIDAITDAKRVAHHLKIPHYTLNIRDEFKHHVIDYFVNEYLIGQTPNPCVECNRHIKFDALFQKSKELDADYVATGHYCKITKNNKTGKLYLNKAFDLTKDQSYFLYMLQSDQLKKTLFPLGNYTKTRIREMAESFGLLNAKKSDSQDICFVTRGGYSDFIDKHINKPVRPGNIIDKDGKVLGEHKGIHHYTIGQKKGLSLPFPAPLYVIKINARDNTLIVGQKEDLQDTIIKLSTVTLVNPNDSILGHTFDIKTRSQMIAFKATIIEQTPTTLTLHTSTPQHCLSPGQSGVLYLKNRVIGGGIITL